MISIGTNSPAPACQMNFAPVHALRAICRTLVKAVAALASEFQISMLNSIQNGPHPKSLLYQSSME